MSLFSDAEYAMLANLPAGDIVALAAELDIIVPAQIERRPLLEDCVQRLLVRARQDGLPFSKYDRMDLEELEAHHLEAIGRLQGIQGRVTVDAVLKVGQKVYKVYTSHREDNPIALMLPMLLTAVARAAIHAHEER